VGGLLWGLWLLLWRSIAWPVVASGAIFPLGLAMALKAGVVRLDFPARAWLRWDLWALLALLLSFRVAQGVLTTSYAILTGRARSGVIAVPVRLTSDMGRLLFLWAVTVTPGTIALLLEEELLYVHCLRRPRGMTPTGLTALEGVLLRLWG